MVSIRQFKPEDKETLLELIVELQDYLIKIDPLKKLRRLPGYEEKYIGNLLKKIEGKNGAIYIANVGNIPFGFIAGIIEEQTKDHLLEYMPTKSGRVLELIVSEKQRGKNLGSMLMRKIEEYFLQQNCDVVRVEIFKTNNPAHNFYKKHGYDDRNIDMIKKIRNSV